MGNENGIRERNEIKVNYLTAVGCSPKTNCQQKSDFTFAFGRRRILNISTFVFISRSSVTLRTGLTARVVADDNRSMFKAPFVRVIRTTIKWSDQPDTHCPIVSFPRSLQVGPIAYWFNMTKTQCISPNPLTRQKTPQRKAHSWKSMQ